MLRCALARLQGARAEGSAGLPPGFSTRPERRLGSRGVPRLSSRGRGVLLLLVLAANLLVLASQLARTFAPPVAAAPAGSAVLLPAGMPSSDFGGASGAQLVLQYVRETKAGADPAPLRPLLLEACARLDSAQGLSPHLVQAFCRRTLGLPETRRLGPMEEIEYGYFFGPGRDPEPFLEFLATQDPHSVPEAVSQVGFNLFSQERLKVLSSCVSRVAPPLQGRSVADVGTGLGVLLPYLVGEAGPGGTVWAVDIDPSVLQFIRYAATHGMPDLQQVRLVTATEDDLRLPREEVDVAFLIDTNFGYRDGKNSLEWCAWAQDPDRSQARTRAAVGLLASIRGVLKPGGHAVVMEWVSAPRGRLSRLREGLGKVTLQAGLDLEEVQWLDARTRRPPAPLPEPEAGEPDPPVQWILVMRAKSA